MPLLASGERMGRVRVGKWSLAFWQILRAIFFILIVSQTPKNPLSGVLENGITRNRRAWRSRWRHPNRVRIHLGFSMPNQERQREIDLENRVPSVEKGFLQFPDLP